MRTLSIRQPWAGLIVAGIKDIENRSWSTSYRGPILIHAGKAKPPADWLEEIEDEHDIKIPRMEFGGNRSQATSREELTRDERCSCWRRTGYGRTGFLGSPGGGWQGL
jgi:hypothetical protein